MRRRRGLVGSASGASVDVESESRMAVFLVQEGARSESNPRLTARREGWSMGWIFGGATGSRHHVKSALPRNAVDRGRSLSLEERRLLEAQAGQDLLHP